ncbi:hypothetical protein ESA94_11125 [Lacibacter luteus]|uniref:Uncharacterized protein n=1 Tax=Lacibacter luteus TaxID=2508719 RepID=A0A4Q1CH29_9BACT|nr:hypothetical protein [Lacibacter luteus]RXK59616.1 hypothetical protein ESA94_11125 [Lacibacter luteus]
MSKTPTDIFKQLQQYEVTVPANLWEQLRIALFEQDEQSSLHKLQMLEVPPPDHLFEQVMEEVEDLRLKEETSKLTQFELAPPVLLYDRLKQKQQPATVWTLFNYKRRFFYYAAAILLFMLAVAIAFRISFTKEKTDATADAPKQNQSVSPVSDTATVVTTPVQTKTAVAANKRTVYLNSGIKEKFYMDVPSVFIGRRRVPVYNNDLLFSFTSMSFSEGRSVFKEKNKPVIVKVDDYTNIRVSDFMSKQLSDVFRTKRNGKPAHAAKRAKARINNWQKADRKAFDKSKTKSPHDIIDLTETIF